MLMVGVLVLVSATPDSQAQSGRSGPRQMWSASQFVGLSGASVSRDGRYVLYTDW